jgi:hypothetical protein
MKRYGSSPGPVRGQLIHREQQRRRAAALQLAGAATLGGLLGLAAPAAEARTVSGTENSTVVLNNGETLTVTSTGVIDTLVNGGDGVNRAAAGISVGPILNQGEIKAKADGLELDGATITNGGSGPSLRNENTIDAAEDGIDSDNTTYNGDIENTGTLKAVGEGFDFSSVTVNGNITNSGDISGADGIELDETSEVTGNVTNAVGGTIEAVDDGILLISGSRVGGNILNAGGITVGEDGIDLSNVSSVGGNIANTGIIDAGDDGIDINTNSVVEGAIQNSGTINADSNGIYVSGGSEVQGGIHNQAGGTIDSNGDGIDLDLGGSAASITNDGTITASDDGIDIASSGAVNGAITNTGSITGDDHSILITISSAVAGGIANSGSLIGGLVVLGGDGSGNGIDLENAGTIDLGETPSVVSGDFSQTDSGIFRLTLLNLIDYGTGSAMSIFGDALLDGSLFLGFTNGFSLGGGERFNLFDIDGSRTGVFANLAQDAIVGTFGAYNLRIDYTGEGNIELYSQHIPELDAASGTGALSLLAGALALLRERRRPA